MPEDFLPYIVLASVVVIFAFLVVRKLKKPSPYGTTKQAANSKATALKARVKEDDVVVYYGSQTGTAETFSNQLVEEASSRGLQAKAVDLEDFTESMLLDSKHGVHVFVMATYGEGDPTDNAVQFMKWLTDVPADPDMSHIKFTVFGLGNKQYELFNKSGRDTQRLLSERGAHSVYPYGEGDDDDNIEDDFEKWREGIWPMVCDALGVTCTSIATNGAGGSNPSKPHPVYCVTHHNHGDNENNNNNNNDNSSKFVHWKPNPSTKLFDQHHPFESNVTVNTELFASDRSCRHIEIPIPKSVSYLTGDHLAVLPENPPKLVTRLATRLELSLNSTVTLSFPESSKSNAKTTTSSTTNNHKLPFHGQAVSVCDVLSMCVDLTCVVPHTTMGVLGLYASKEQERDELLTLGTKEGKATFMEQYHNPMMTLLEVLEKFRSVKLSLEELLAVGCRLQPRFYSICSSNMRNPDSIHLCVAVVQFEKPNDRNHDGVCSTFLQKLVPSVDKVRCFVRRSTFHPPASPTTPVLMIGPGTGIAPFRGFVHDREMMLEQGKVLGDGVLFFGCRYEQTEFLYRDDLEHAVQLKALSQLHVAVSRDKVKPKKYVQHLLRDNADQIRDLLSRGCHVYVCGLVEMSRDVAEALTEIMGNENKKEGEKAWAKLKTDGRFKTDVWS